MPASFTIGGKKEPTPPPTPNHVCWLGYMRTNGRPKTNSSDIMGCHPATDLCLEKQLHLLLWNLRDLTLKFPFPSIPSFAFPPTVVLCFNCLSLGQVSVVTFCPQPHHLPRSETISQLKWLSSHICKNLTKIQSSSRWKKKTWGVGLRASSPSPSLLFTDGDGNSACFSLEKIQAVYR